MFSEVSINIWFIVGSIGALFSLLFSIRCLFLPERALPFLPAGITLAVFQTGLALLTSVRFPNMIPLILIAAGFWLMAPAWTLFSIIFARDNESAKLKNWRLYLVTISIIGLVQFLWIVSQSGWRIKFIQSGPLNLPVTLWTSIYFAFLIITSALILIHLENTFRSAKRDEKSRIGLMLFFVGTIFATIIYISSQGLIYNYIPSDTIIALILICAPASIGIFWQSLREDVFRIRIKLTRATIYSSAVFLLLGFYLLIVGLTAKILQYFGGSWQVFLSALAGFLVVLILLIILVSQSVQLRAKRIVDHYFSPEKFDYRQQWSEFSENIASITSLDELVDTAIKNLRNIFKPSSILLMLPDRDERKLIPYKTDDNFKNMRIEFKGNLIDFLFRSAEPQPYSALSNDVNIYMELKPIEKVYPDLTLCLPLVAQHKLTGIMFLGNRPQGKAYSEEDYSFLDTWGHQLAVAILHVQSAQKLAEARELESYHRLSTFVAHDLKNAVSMLSLLLKNAEKNMHKPEFQEEALKTITGAVNKMSNIIGKFSSPTRGFEVRKSAFKADEPVREVIKNTKIDAMEKIDFAFHDENSPVIESDSGMVERILNNLIINAIEAQNGEGSITVNIKKSDNNIIYNVEDAGPGMSHDFIENKLFKPFASTKKKGLGIGLYQCREMASALNGDLLVESETGRGTTFSLVLNDCAI
ncbi:MAG: PEP-CTERM system histidine kinase PrsK [candidate division Zixibacteria bacterium]|nr:PEP-CTERM system histidine kinase PrsK [candidate division Zixibacteria bacterium]